MKKKHCAAERLLLFLIVLLGFGVRLIAIRLPGLSEAQRAAYTAEDGGPYLSDPDSYYYLRLTRQMAEEGRPFAVNARVSDPLMGSRAVADNEGRGEPMLLPLLTYALWRMLSVFFPLTPLALARWMGPLCGSLAAIPAFLYVRRRTNAAGGAAAGLLCGLAIPFAAQTASGYFDTDMLLSVLPLGFILLHLRAMQERTLRRQLLCSAGCGLCLGLISLLWMPFYTYFWLLILGGALSCLLALLLRELRALRGFALSAAFSLLFVALLRGRAGLSSLSEVAAMFRSVAGSADAFPFAHAYTVEMRPLPLLPAGGGLRLLAGSASTVLGRLGGALPCLAALSALPLLALDARRRGKRDGGDRHALLCLATEAGTLGLWLLVGLRLSLSSLRFTEIAVLPLGVLAGLALGSLPARRPAAALAVACCLPTILGAARFACENRPSVNDAKQAAMAYVRETQPGDAVLASWWNDGYFMEYEARRRCVADGGTSSGRMNTFLAYALLTDDARQMAGILRMLETSGTEAVSFLTDAGFTQAEAAALLLECAPCPRQEAEARLGNTGRLTKEQRDALLKMTHPGEHRPLCLVLGSDLLAKLQAIAYYGRWDLNAMAPGPGAFCAAGREQAALPPGGECSFTVGSLHLRFTRSETGEIRMLPPEGGPFRRPARLSLWRDGVLAQDQRWAGGDYAVLLLETEGSLSAFCCSPDLADSMLVRLLVCHERGLPGVRLLGSWPEGAGDAARLQTSDRSAWSAEVWAVEE